MITDPDREREADTLPVDERRAEPFPDPADQEDAWHAMKGEDRYLRHVLGYEGMDPFEAKA